MKLTTLITIVALSTRTAVARPPHHRHQHAQRAPVSIEQDTVDTVFVYEYEGHPISAAEVQEGIANGTLVYASNGAVVLKVPVSPSSNEVLPAASASDSPLSSSVAIAASWPLPSPSEDAPQQAPPTTTALQGLSPAVSPSSSVAASPLSSAPASPSSTPSDSSPWSWAPTSQGLDADFPDGQLDCSVFPADYGAVALNYLGLDGWSGIQCPGSETAQGFADIDTKTTGSCGEGDFCSYACPAGYEKTQWPSVQGSTGQSLGGIKCINGKLRLTNPNLSTKLCSPGSTQVPVTVQNTMSEGASICRTDYPGTEGEVIPLQANAGTSTNITCPDAAHYYDWLGKSTSAQYYVNPKGVSSEQGCQWGSPSNNWGNFAPLNLGVGYSNGAAWLSIFQNLPTTNAKLDFSVEIVGNDGGYDNLVGRCKYENGQYCSGEDYSQKSSDGNGCTVSVSHGTATFVLSS